MYDDSDIVLIMFFVLLPLIAVIFGVVADTYELRHEPKTIEIVVESDNQVFMDNNTLICTGIL